MVWMVWMVWIGGALVLAVIETLTADLTFLMLAGGALGGSVAAALGAPLVVQVVAFGLVSALLLFALRPWVRRRLTSTTPRIRTNVDALIGVGATTITAVDDQGGRVRLSGGEWSARLAPDPQERGGRLEPGTEVTVTQIDGAVAVVAPVGSVHAVGAPQAHGG